MPAPHLLGLRAPAGGGEPDAARRVGRSGAEAAFDGILSHRPGSLRIWEDRRGATVRTAPLTPPAPGGDVTLTVHAGLQRAVAARLAAALEPRPGRPTPTGAAAVVLDVRDGSILAAASAPTFDPAARSDPAAWAALATDPRAPLLDRVTAGLYPPGSAFKPVIVAAALEELAVYGDGTLDCRGFLDTPRRHRCACFVTQQVGHGLTTPADALCRSCNVWCFDAAERAGAEALAEWAGRFGFGSPPGTGLPGERGGSALPAGFEADAPRGRDVLLEAAIGQGPVLATPLQVCRMTAAVANGGRLVTPRLSRISPAAPSPPGGGRPLLTADTLAVLREGMERAVNDPRGTAYRHARRRDVRLAGKTGTAQVAGKPSHAWFTGYAPADRPTIAVTVLLEHGGSGGADAGPVARDLVGAAITAGFVMTDRPEPRKPRVESPAKPQARIEPFTIRRVRPQ